MLGIRRRLFGLLLVASLGLPVVATAAAERWSAMRRTSDSVVQMPVVVAGTFVAGIGVLTIIGAMQLQARFPAGAPATAAIQRRVRRTWQRSCRALGCSTTTPGAAT